MNTTTSLEDKALSSAGTAPADSGWVRTLARMKAASLDRRLAAGQAPESDRLLAARADLIVGRRSRQRLADNWEHLLTAARMPITPWGPRFAVRATTVLLAEQPLRELVAMIREPVRVNPRGVALARLLLSDGAGPLYNNPRRSADLIPALRAAAAALTITGADKGNEVAPVPSSSSDVLCAPRLGR
jgi:hypothetical protein